MEYLVSVSLGREAPKLLFWAGELAEEEQLLCGRVMPDNKLRKQLSALFLLSPGAS